VKAPAPGGDVGINAGKVVFDDSLGAGGQRRRLAQQVHSAAVWRHVLRHAGAALDQGLADHCPPRQKMPLILINKYYKYALDDMMAGNIC